MDTRQRLIAGSAILRPDGRIDLSNAEAFKEALLSAVA